MTSSPLLLRSLWLPSALYLVVFFVLNPHLLAQFSTGYYFGGADGYQNIWNLWWVDKSVREFQALPWFTTYLHHPAGTTLVGHTLNPFNGLLAIGLLPIASMVQAYNTIVIISFVTGGLTAFWLCRRVTGSYVGSLIGGAVFTFSSFHYMHADAHLQLTALQGIPLFVLAWIRFCERPTYGRAGVAAAVLLQVVLCDLYYFAYCVFAGAFFAFWMGRRDGDLLWLFRRHAWPTLLGFVTPTLLTSGVLMSALVYQHATDPLFGTHSPRDLSMDLLSPVVWGYYWRFRDAVRPLWFPLSKYVTEASVHLGLSVIALGAYAWTQRSRVRIAYQPYWLIIAAFFGVMALGPNLRVGGFELSTGLRISLMGHDDVNILVLPYAMLWLIFPPWRLAGVPVRMMVMVQLVAAVMAAGGWHALQTSSLKWRRPLAAAFLVLFVLEYLPFPQRVVSPAIPAYVQALKQLPDGAVLDLASNAPLALYYQTVHEKPIAFGYIARTPTSVEAADQALARLILDGQWERAAAAYQFRYVVKAGRAADVMVRGLSEAPLSEIDPARKIYSDDHVAIYRF